MNWSKQVKDVIAAAIINIIWTIWFSRNRLKFDNKKISIRATINMVIASASLTGKLSKSHSFSSSIESQILGSFKVSAHLGKVPKVIPVCWIPPLCGWIKAHTDGSALGSPGPSGGGAIFKDKSGAVLGCFWDYYGIFYAFHVLL